MTQINRQRLQLRNRTRNHIVTEIEVRQVGGQRRQCADKGAKVVQTEVGVRQRRRERLEFRHGLANHILLHRKPAQAIGQLLHVLDRRGQVVLELGGDGVGDKRSRAIAYLSAQIVSEAHHNGFTPWPSRA